MSRAEPVPDHLEVDAPTVDSWRRTLGLVFAVALGLRLCFLAEISLNHSPDAYSFLDQAANRYWARTILSGDVLGRDAAFPPEAPYKNNVYFKPPLYPFSLALVLGLSGDRILAMQLLQALVSSLACVALAMLSRRLGLAPRVAGWAGLGLGLYGPHIFLCGMLLPETFYITAVLGLLLALVGLRRAPSGGRVFRVGVLFGLCALLRPNILAFAPLAAIWFLLSIRRSVPPGRIAGWTALALAGLALTIGPVTLRNHFVAGDDVILSYYGGYNFFVGNNEKCSHGTVYYDGERLKAAVREAAERAGRPLLGSEISSVGWSLGLAFIREQPVAYARLLAGKAYRALDSRELMSNQDIYTMRRYSLLLSALVWRVGSFGFPFGLLMPLSFAGAGFWLAQRRDPLPLLYLVAGGVGLLLFFVTFRHRLPLVPIALLLAAHGGSELARGLRERRKGRFAWLALAATLLLLGSSNLDGFDPSGERELIRANLGNAYLNHAAALAERGEWLEAARRLEQASRDLPGDPRFATTRAFILAAAPGVGEQAGTQAAALAARLYRDTPGGETLYTLAAALAASGDFGEAARAVEHLLSAEADPRSPRALHLQRVRAEFEAGRPLRLPERMIVRQGRLQAVPKWYTHLPPWLLVSQPWPYSNEP